MCYCRCPVPYVGAQLQVQRSLARQSGEGDLKNGRMTMKIAVFKHDSVSMQMKDRICHVSKGEARHMVESGWADRISKYVIRLKRLRLYHPIRSGQAVAYESVGAERFPRIFLGGLTRTEHCPKPIPKFKGARVNH